ncbi:MAG: hypothetical protein J0H94_16545 [Rhizobiales bacterium]|nr:hypothetical protein [Hyphomicrobiales bacterium]
MAVVPAVECQATAILETSLPLPRLPGAGRHLSLLSANRDGLYTAGSHLALFDAGGRLLWAREMPCSIAAVAALPSGGVAVSGRCARIVPYGKTGGRVEAIGPAVLRFTATGDLVWAKTYSLGQDARIVALAVADDGTLGVAGNVFTFAGPPALGRKKSQPFVLKLTESGDVIWGRGLTGKALRSEISALVASGGGRLAAIVDGALVTMGAEGDIESARAFRLEGKQVTLRALIQSENRLILAGAQGREDARAGDGVVIAVNPVGDIAWAAMIDGGPDDRIWALAGADNGSVWISGNSIRMGATLEDPIRAQAAWLARLDHDGRVEHSKIAGGDGEGSFGGIAAYQGAVFASGSLTTQNRRRAVLAVLSASLSSDTCGAMIDAPVKAYPTAADGISIYLSTSPLAVSAKEFQVDIAASEARVKDLCPLGVLPLP